MNKKCSQCLQIKDSQNDYYWSNGKTRTICKDCVRENERKRYASKMEEFIAFKQTLQCRKCGERRWYLLDFHHRNPDEKDYVVSDLTRTPISKIMEEVKKCDPLCANCHREWHYLSTHTKDLIYNAWLGE